MRICYVCCEYPPGPHGGVGTLTQMLSRSLVNEGHDVRVIGLYPTSYPGPDYIEDQGVRVWRLREPHFRCGWIWGRYRMFRQIANWCRRGDVDLVEVPDAQGWSAGWPRLPVPVVMRLNGSHTYFANELNEPFHKRTSILERAALRRADRWCSASRYTADKTRRLFQLDSGPEAILYNPVETPSSGPQPDRSKNDVVFTGTLTYKKGVISLFKAWPQVLQRCAAAKLHLYGKDGRTHDGGSMRSTLLSMLDDSQRQTVLFHGHARRDELFQALRRARSAVFPSYAEAFAIAPLEAMSTGCPTVYTNRGSASELMKDGREGLLVDPDQPGEIAEAIVRIVNDDRLASRLGAAGRKRVQQRFAVNTQLAENVAFYRECVRETDRIAARSSRAIADLSMLIELSKQMVLPAQVDVRTGME